MSKSMLFATEEDAYEWAEENGYTVEKIQVTEDGALLWYH